VLQRRPIVSVESVEEDYAMLDADDYEIDAPAGMLRRLWDDLPASWRTTKLVVSYTAGWDKVPRGLKTAAGQLARLYWFRGSRDPALKQMAIPGVIERQYYATTAIADPDIPTQVMDMLSPFINTVVG
jgi:hypothetical protein